MADRTLTINHADGGSETYTINRDKFAGVRDMTVDGETVSVDHTAVPKEQSKETTFGGSQSITVKRDIEPLLKDVVGGAAAAYSLRDLNDVLGNSNKVVRVRRSSDNAEKDFTASEMGAALEDWVGALNDGYVETWYDQSGSGNDATQTVAANQPKIVDAGTYLGEIDFDGSDDRMDISGLALASLNYGAFAVASIDDPTTSNLRTIFDSTDYSDAGFALSYGNTASKLTPFWFDGDDTTANVFSGGSNLTSSESLYSAIIKSGASTTHINGSLNETLTNTWATAGTNSFTKSTIGYDQTAPTRNFNGKLKELIIYNTDQSSNRTAIEANINNHYSIY